MMSSNLQASRRTFLGRSLFVSAAAAPAASLLLNPEFAKAQSGRSRSVVSVFESIQNHENDHVLFLEMALGAAARPKPIFQNLDQPTFRQFTIVSQALENTGVGAYLNAAPAINDRATLASAGSIATVEARHAGFLNVYLSDPITQNDESFETPLTPAEVRAAAGPFIASLNGGPPIDYDPNVLSAQNDIDILNFALALEYLEADFYNINVPKFFSRPRR